MAMPLFKPHGVGTALVVAVGNSFTVTVTVVEFVQPAALVPVIVYVVVMVGLAVVVEPVVELKVIDGDQL